MAYILIFNYIIIRITVDKPRIVILKIFEELQWFIIAIINIMGII